MQPKSAHQLPSMYFVDLDHQRQDFLAYLILLRYSAVTHLDEINNIDSNYCVQKQFLTDLKRT